MSATHILALDLGSSGLRSLLAPVETPWKLTPGAALPYRPLRARGGEGLAVRFSPDELWKRVARVIQEGVRAAGLQAGDIAAIGVTSQRQGVAFLGGAGVTLYVGPNVDLRAVFEGAAIDDTLADVVYQTTGHLPSLFFTPAKLRWWKHHHPRLHRRIRRVLTLGAWVAYRLTGEVADVPSLQSEAGLLDVSSRGPATALLQELGVDTPLLPPLAEEGKSFGGLTSGGGRPRWAESWRPRGPGWPRHADRPTGHGRHGARQRGRGGGMERAGADGHRAACLR